MDKKRVLEKVRHEVIDLLKSNETIKQGVEQEIFEILKTLWDAEKMSTEYKFSDDDFYEYPLEIAYLLYSCSIQLFAVIQEKNKIFEYWDFYYETYPELKFQGNMQEFYDCVKKAE